VSQPSSVPTISLTDFVL